MERRKKVLVVGGTGYLGQHVLEGLKDGPYDVGFTHHSGSAPPSPLLRSLPPRSLAFHVDLRTGHGFHSISQEFGPPDVVVNCAAISVPRVCENDPSAAMSVNVPTALVDWLGSCDKGRDREALLVHLSTDQVYEGAKSFYKEEDEVRPVNVYGKSKVVAEQYIAEKCSNYAVLRSSIIYGPQSVSPVPKALPIQWMDGVLAKGEDVEFFHDEFRCPVYVKDVVKVILSLANMWISEGKQMQLLLNVGGPDRVSRVQMAEAVAHVRGYTTSLIKPVSASSVDCGVSSPADISMDISKLVSTTNVIPTSFRDGVKLTLGSHKKKA